MRHGAVPKEEDNFHVDAGHKEIAKRKTPPLRQTAPLPCVETPPLPASDSASALR